MSFRDTDLCRNIRSAVHFEGKDMIVFYMNKPENQCMDCKKYIEFQGRDYCLARYRSVR